MTPPVRKRRVLPTASLVAVAFSISTWPSPSLLAQSKEWWDLHEEARKVIESSTPTESQLKDAVRSLTAAIGKKDSEGYFATINQSDKIDYLPYFYRAVAEMKLKRYDEAQKDFAKSESLNHIRKGAPAPLKAKFDNYQKLVSQLAPAAEALRTAKESSVAKECVGDAGSSSGSRIKDLTAKLDAMLLNPSDAGALKGLAGDLNGAVKDCDKEMVDKIVQLRMKDYEAARDGVSIEGIADLVASETKSELDGALGDGKKAAAEKDARGLEKATGRLRSVESKLGHDLDAKKSQLLQDAERLLNGNQRALDQQNQLGGKVAAAMTDIKNKDASGKSGKELAAFAKAVADFKSLVGSASDALAPILAAKAANLEKAKSDHDTWAATHACDINAVGAKDTAGGVQKEYAAARQSKSGDAMETAVARIAAIRPDVESKMKDILPRKEEAARTYLPEAAGLISKIPSAADQEKGNAFKKSIETALQNKDVCGIDTSMTTLADFLKDRLKVLEPARNAAIARNRPALDDGESLLAGFGGILKSETLAALKPPVDRLGALVKTSYDAALMDRTGQELKGVVDRAKGEVRGQLVEGIKEIKVLRSNPLWQESVTPARRQWLEQNLSGVEKAVQEVSNPDLMGRFAREYPRARLEMALATAFSSLYDKGDAASAAKTLEDLGPGVRSGSAALNYSLSYFYWWQGQAASSADKEAFMARAREAYDSGKSLHVDLAALGASLFAPAYVEEMSRR